MIKWIIERITYRKRSEEMLRHLRTMLHNDAQWLSHGNKTAEILCSRYLQAIDPQWEKYADLPRDEIRDIIKRHSLTNGATDTAKSSRT